MKKRAFSVLVTLCLVLTLLPTSALAGSPANEVKWSTDSGTIWVEGSLLDGVSAVTTAGGGTIMLLSDVAGSAGATFGTAGTYTLDLGGHTLAARSAATALTVSTGADLTICGSGSVIGGPLGSTMPTSGANAVSMKGGALTVTDSVILTGGSGNIVGMGAVRAIGGKVTVTGSASLSAGAGAVLGEFCLYATDGAEIVISGSPTIAGSVDAHGVFIVDGSVDISGTPTIKGGEGSMDASVGLYISNSRATVSGGTFSGDDNGLGINDDNSQVTLSGGTFTGGINSVRIALGAKMTLADLLDKGKTFLYTKDDSAVADLTKRTIKASVKVAALSKYTVTYSHVNGDIMFGDQCPSSVDHGGTLTASFVATPPDVMSKTIVVTMDGVLLDDKQYTYTRDRKNMGATLTVPNVTGALDVKASISPAYTAAFAGGEGATGSVPPRERLEVGDTTLYTMTLHELSSAFSVTATFPNPSATAKLAFYKNGEKILDAKQLIHGAPYTIAQNQFEADTEHRIDISVTSADRSQHKTYTLILKIGSVTYKVTDKSGTEVPNSIVSDVTGLNNAVDTSAEVAAGKTVEIQLRVDGAPTVSDAKKTLISAVIGASAASEIASCAVQGGGGRE